MASNKEFTKTGIVPSNLKVSELITYLQENVEFFGDTPVKFQLDGEDCMVQFASYENALVIDVDEYF